MRVIVAGSRGITDADAVERVIAIAGLEISELVHGNARGVDRLARDWAIRQGIPHTPFPVTQQDWARYGTRAGMLRNEDMAIYVGSHGALIALWDGVSPGTRGMLQIASDYGLALYPYLYSPDYRSVDPIHLWPHGGYAFI